MEKHFVTFYSPGTIFSETSEKPIDSWDVDKAVEMARTIVERHDAIPYGFSFTTYGRTDEELDSKVVNRSPMYFLGGKIETLEEIEERNDPKENILRSNMRNNDYNRVIVNTNSWKVTLPLNDDDIVLDVSLKWAEI